jgi:hypothetical protein
MDDAIERPTRSGGMTETGRSGGVRGIETTADGPIGGSIRGPDGRLPDGVSIAPVGPDGDSQRPDPDPTRFCTAIT